RALESIQRGKERVAIVQAGLFDANGRPAGAVYRSLRLNFLRIKSGQGTPLEVLDSARRLTDILTVYGQALSSYDRARYRMLVALGLPTPALIDPRCMPLPPPPLPGSGDAPPARLSVLPPADGKEALRQLPPANSGRGPQPAGTPVLNPV